VNRRNERIPSPAPPASSSARGSAFRPTARSGRARCLPTASRARSSTRRLMPRSALRTPRSSTTPLAIPRASFLWTTPTTSCSESATHFTSDRCLPPGPAAVRDRRRAVGPAPPRVDPRRAARPEAASPAAGNRRPLSGPPDPQRGGDSGDRSGERRNKRALNRAPNVGRYRTPPRVIAGRPGARPARDDPRRGHRSEIVLCSHITWTKPPGLGNFTPIPSLGRSITWTSPIGRCVQFQH